MDTMLLWGLDFIRFIQTYENPQLTFFMKMVSFFGGIPLIMLLLPFFYWCVSEKKSLHLYVMFLFSLLVNVLFKFLLNQPRPFFSDYDPSVGILLERMGGLPSGHAQNTLVVFLIIASWIALRTKNNVIPYVFAGLLCFVIGFSRIYLGVHFPTDVLAGWIIGGIIFYGYLKLNDKVEWLLSLFSFRAKMIAISAISFVFITVTPGRDALLAGGTMFGICGGFCLNRRYIGFENPITKVFGIKKYLLLSARLLLGVAGLVIVIFAIGYFIPNSSQHNLLGFIRFLLGGLWVSLVAPWVFIKLKLADKGELAAAEENHE